MGLLCRRQISIPELIQAFDASHVSDAFVSFCRDTAQSIPGIFEFQLFSAACFKHVALILQK